MNYRGPFRLDQRQRESISVEDLAAHVLKVLQRNLSGPREPGGYWPGQLSSIRAFEILDRNDPTDRPSPAFERKWAEAKHRLFQERLVIQDPGQSSDDFVVLTSAGEAADTSAPVFGVWDVDRFLTSIRERAGGDLDPVVAQYLGESYRAACADLWVAATFMLGAASERALHIISQKVASLISDPAQTRKLEDVRHKARQVKEWILVQLKPLRKARPDADAVLIDVEDKITMLFGLYRYQRNEAGHPNDTVMAPDKEASGILSSEPRCICTPSNMGLRTRAAVARPTMGQAGGCRRATSWASSGCRRDPSPKPP